ncbi:hypothetical protein [Nocardioides sp.]|uniref:TY-Chap domain-containing protein n=1 Tax=Nocardioides sp. TaxID=35761 RepID=UPI0035123BFD
MNGTWEDLNRRLTGAILGLDLHDVLEIRERAPQAPRSRWRRRAASGGPAAPTRFVRITAARDVLIGECVGATEFGGEWPMDAAQQAALERQGWSRPWSPDYPTYQREHSLAEAPRLALAAVRALELLGAQMADLEVRLSREDPT